MELVEVSPPYDASDITAFMGKRVIVDVLGSLVAHGKLGAHKRHIDKPGIAQSLGQFDEGQNAVRCSKTILFRDGPKP